MAVDGGVAEAFAGTCCAEHGRSESRWKDVHLLPEGNMSDEHLADTDD